MNFSKALNCLKRGGKITRKSWSNHDSWLELHTPHNKNTTSPSYITITTATGTTIWWLPEHGDILAEDWIKIGWAMKLLLLFLSGVKSKLTREDTT